MAPAVGSTEMRYCGISLFRRFARPTMALWPEVPTGGVPHRMSCCDQAAEVVIPSSAAKAAVVRARLSMAFPFPGTAWTIADGGGSPEATGGLFMARTRGPPFLEIR